MAKSTAEKYSQISIQTISQIRGQEDFVEFLRIELEWPIPLHIDRLEDVSIPHDLQRDFGFSQAEDRIQVSRLLNLNEDQPWGIFLFEFKTKRPYLSHLRQLLRKLSSRRTLQRGDPIWDRNDLLFICTQDWQEYQFVHFSGERPESAVISSFGWKGPDDRFLHTLCKHNLPRLRMPDPAPDGSISADDWRSQWRDAFNIKPVTDEFYATLKEVFHAVESGITGLQGEDRRAFTELMINRLIFLKFVEKKGWLNNDRDYLFLHFQKFGGDRYWKDFLYHLFFEGLNTDPAQRPAEASRVLGDVPYLNAELFSLSEQWNDNQVDVEGRSLDLLFDKLLNPYNFTVAETSPLEVEVAFNQDLLGYAYEELIADQHGQGAYYTHPTEVNLMCRESLRAFLEERCPQVEKELIARLVYGELSVTGGGTALTPAHAVDLYSALHDVTICDPAIGSGTFPVAMVKHLFTCLRSLGQILKEYAPFRELIDQAALTDWRKGYELKLHIIERSIYGCDIDYFAVQIAKLRFWIELMVECDQPVPLPNFDFKLLVGDALVSSLGSDRRGSPITLEEIWGHPTKPIGQASLSFELARAFAERKQSYYSVQESTQRIDLRNKILDARNQLIENALGFARRIDKPTNLHILWQIDFVEVFLKENPGFDIVLANPPYLRQEKIDDAFAEFNIKIKKDDLVNIYGTLSSSKINKKSDLYIYFFLRGLMLLRSRKGVLCYICSNSWLDTDFGSDFQKILITNHRVLIVIDSKNRSFEQADINTVIVFIESQKPEPENVVGFIKLSERIGTSRLPMTSMTQESDKGYFEGEWGSANWIGIEQLQRGFTKDASLNTKWGGRYFKAPSFYESLQEITSSRCKVLSHYATIRFGCHTGINDFFYLDKKTIEQWGIETQFIIPLIRKTSDIGTPIINIDELASSVFVCSLSKDELVKRKLNGALEYILWGEKQVTRKRQQTEAGIHWPDVPSVKNRTPGWWSLSEADVIKTRCFVQYVTGSYYRAPYSSGFTTSDACFHRIIPNDIKESEVISALLNSSITLLDILLFARSNLGLGALKFERSDVERINIPDLRLLNLETKKDLSNALNQYGYSPYYPLSQWKHFDLAQQVDDILFKFFNIPKEISISFHEYISDLTQERFEKVSSLDED